MKRFTLAMVAICAVGLFSGCQRSSVINIPPPPPARMFVSNSNFGGLGTFSVSIFTQPLTPASTASVTLGAANGLVANPSGSAFDSKGNFYIIDEFSKSIYIYAPPVTATSTPSVVLGPVAAFNNAFSLALDAAGDIWISSFGTSTIYEFKPPFVTGVPVPALTMNATTPALSGPSGLIFDSLGRMFVANYTASQLLVFSPPFTAASAAIATITVPSQPTGLAVDLQDRLVVVEYNTGNIDVYNPPYATGNLPKFVIAAPTVSGGTASETYQPVFGPDGNLYVPYQIDGATGDVSIFPQPLNAGSVPTFSLPGAGQPSAVSFGP